MPSTIRAIAAISFTGNPILLSFRPLISFTLSTGLESSFVSTTVLGDVHRGPQPDILYGPDDPDDALDVVWCRRFHPCFIPMSLSTTQGRGLRHSLVRRTRSGVCRHGNIPLHKYHLVSVQRRRDDTRSPDNGLHALQGWPVFRLEQDIKVLGFGGFEFRSGARYQGIRVWGF